jgi:hypothetical protein
LNDLPTEPPEWAQIRTAASTASQNLTDAANQTSDSEQSWFNQELQATSPSSPQFQQETQCTQQAGTNSAAIQQCVQQYAQSLPNPVSPQTAILTQLTQEVAADLANASSAFTNLSNTVSVEFTEFKQLFLPKAVANGIASQLYGDYLQLQDDCEVGIANSSLADLGTDLTKLASDQAAINALVQESGTWSKDFVAFEGALGYTQSGSFKGIQATS